MSWIQNLPGVASMTQGPRYINGPDNDSDRHARRRELKRQDAAALIETERWQQFNAAIDVCLATKEALAAEHVNDCQPIQQELAALEQQQIDDVVSNRPRDAELQSRFQQLEAELRDRNLALEAAIAAEDKMIGKLSEERRVAGMKSNRNVIRNELLQTASPPVAMEVRVSASRFTSAKARFDALRAAGETPFALALLADAEKELARAEKLAAEAEEAALAED